VGRRIDQRLSATGAVITPQHPFVQTSAVKDMLATFPTNGNEFVTATVAEFREANGARGGCSGLSVKVT